jgi:hypothetical protein
MNRSALDDVEVMYNELINASQAVAILAENVRKMYPQDDMVGSLAQSSLELVDRLDEMHAYVSKGGPLPGQLQEVQMQAGMKALKHLACVAALVA